MTDLSPYIEYTLLRQDTTWAEVKEMCRVAKEKNFAALCVPPWLVKKTRAELEGSPVKLCSVAGFPMGYGLMLSKWTETLQVHAEGAEEVGVMLNLSALRSGDMERVRQEIGGLGVQSRERGTVLKIIVETGMLDFAELDIICGFLLQALPNFVETSTGFSKIGAELDKVQHLREMLPPEIKIKASGGIQTYEQALQFIEAGADRIGTDTILQP